MTEVGGGGATDQTEGVDGYPQMEQMPTDAHSLLSPFVPRDGDV